MGFSFWKERELIFCVRRKGNYYFVCGEEREGERERIPRVRRRKRVKFMRGEGSSFVHMT